MTQSDTLDMPAAPVEFDVFGTRFRIYDPGNTVAAETFCPLGYEPAVVDLLDRLATRHPQAEFLDIGALHGYYSALVASRLPGWTVTAFEPGPEAFDVLKRNFELLSIPGKALRQALNATGDDLHFKGRTLVDAATPDAIVVPGTRLDDIAGTGSAPALVAKIDVHGAEGLVLDGARDTLRNRLDAALVEVHAQHLIVGDYAYARILEMLEEAGLHVFEVDGFRYDRQAKLVPLVGPARRQFVDYELWSEEQVSRERLLLALRAPDLPTV